MDRHGIPFRTRVLVRWASRRPVDGHLLMNIVLFFICCFITALFNNTRTPKLKAQPTNAFFAAVNQVFGGPPSLQLLPNSVRCLNCAQRFDHRALGSSRKLGGAAEHLIDGGEERICRLSFEF